MPNIGTLKLNVEVLDTCDCYNLAVIDLSYYITSVEKPKLTITPPGYNPIVFDFTINQTNIFNSYSSSFLEYILVACGHLQEHVQ